MQRVRIAIDPELKKRFGPEICWTWRLLLSGIGLPWEEVNIDDRKCDIAYALSHPGAHRANLCILANAQLWEQRSCRRVRTIGHCDAWSHPLYEGDHYCFQPFHVRDGCLVCSRDIVFDVFYLATGQEERYWPKDKHGHFDLRETAFHGQRVLALGLASSIGVRLESTLMKLNFRPWIPRWPNGKRAAACVSHDVDYPEIVKWLEPLRIFRRQGLNGLAAAASVFMGRRGHWHCPSWVHMEQTLDTRSAFYFAAGQGSLLKYAAGTPDPFYDVRSERFRKLFRFLAEQGFEIGLHASYRAFESSETFAHEKRVLEEASGQTISGNRHHYWHLNPEDPEATLLIHERIGLKYDTSLTHERYAGWRRGLSWPFFPFHQNERRELKTLQLSTAWMDDHLFGHRQDNPGDRLAILRALADKTAEQGGCLLIDIHDYVFDDVLYPGWAKTYRELWEYIIACSDFWIETPNRVAEHWIARHTAITEASAGLTGTVGCS